MTNAEFKAWFDGFTDGLDGNPTGKQWERIKAKVAAIDGTPINGPYWTPYGTSLTSGTSRALHQGLGNSYQAMGYNQDFTGLNSSAQSGDALNLYDALRQQGKADREAA